MDQVLTQLVERLRKAFDDRLVSVVLYGSGATGERHARFSDYNILCVLAQVTPRERHTTTGGSEEARVRTYRVDDIAAAIGGQVEGPGELLVTGFTGLNTGEQMRGGEIHVDGRIRSVGRTVFGGRIYQRGQLIAP